MRSCAHMLFLALGVVLSMNYGCGSNRPETKVLVSGVLTNEYETVFVADSTLFARTGSFREVPNKIGRMLWLPFAVLVATCKENERIASQHWLGTEALDFVAVGAKNFRSPPNLGGVVSDSCYVLRFRRGSRPDLRRIVPGTPVDVAGRSPVWTWTLHAREGTDYTAYITQPASEYVVISNDLKQLRTISEGIVSDRIKTGDASNPGLTEEVRNSPIWGYRKYHHDVDFASKQASGAMDVDPAGQALVAFTNSTADVLWVRYHSANDLDQTAEKLKRSPMVPKFGPLRAGVWQASISLRDTSVLNWERLFGIMGMFGFGVDL